MGNKTCYAAKFTSSGGNHNNQYMFTTPASLLHCQGRQAMKPRQNAIGTFYVNHTFYCVIRCLNSVFPLGAFMWWGFCRRLRWYMFIWDTLCQPVHMTESGRALLITTLLITTPIRCCWQLMGTITSTQSLQDFTTSYRQSSRQHYTTLCPWQQHLNAPLQLELLRNYPESSSNGVASSDNPFKAPAFTQTNHKAQVRANEDGPSWHGVWKEVFADSGWEIYADGKLNPWMGTCACPCGCRADAWVERREIKARNRTHWWQLPDSWDCRWINVWLTDRNTEQLSDNNRTVYVYKYKSPWSCSCYVSGEMVTASVRVLKPPLKRRGLFFISFTVHLRAELQMACWVSIYPRCNKWSYRMWYRWTAMNNRHTAGCSLCVCQTTQRHRVKRGNPTVKTQCAHVIHSCQWHGVNMSSPIPIMTCHIVVTMTQTQALVWHSAMWQFDSSGIKWLLSLLCTLTIDIVLNPVNP